MKNKFICLLLAGVMVFSNTSMAFAAEGNTDQNQLITEVADAEVKDQFATGADALADKNGVIIDVRSAVNNLKYHVDGTISMPLFDTDNNISLDSALSTRFTEFVTDNKNNLEGKNIYVICNAGKRGAQTASTLLRNAGYKNENIFTITNGIKDLSLLNLAIGEKAWAIDTKGNSFISGKTAVESIGKENVVTLDVRATAVREANGHLEGSVALPLFNHVDGKNQVTNLKDQLATDFLAYVSAHKAELEGKELQILCNGGQSGARSAMKLLLHAGFNFDNLKVITGGASDADVKQAFVVTDRYATGADALADKNGVIIDVRSAVNYGKYHVDGTVSMPLFDKDNKISLDSELSAKFTEFVTGNKDLEGKNIYVICNAGKRGAQTASTLLRKAGYNNANIFTITNGIKDLSLLNLAIGEKAWALDTKGNSFISGKTAVESIGKENVVILDVRATEVRKANGHLEGSVALPLFNHVDGKNQVTNLKDQLATDFLAYVSAHKAELEGKELQILCNGGQSGARSAMKLLLHAGFNFDNLKVITGGASDADVKQAFVVEDQFTTGAVALADKNGVIIDVRSAVNYGKYHVDGTVSMPLFDKDNKISLDSELSAKFTEFVTGNKDLEGKNIYVICNAGKRGAQTASTLLRKAGYSNAKIFTITNGIKDLSLLNLAIGEKAWALDTKGNSFVSGKDAVAAIGNKNVVILDVRATAVRNANGFLKGSVALPLFNHVDGKNQVTNLNDELSTAFLKYVTEHKAELQGKQIMILCNGGQSGARAAMKLLLHAGYNFDNLKVITGGASDAAIKDALIFKEVPPTGDSAPVMALSLLMSFSACIVVVLMRQKKMDII